MLRPVYQMYLRSDTMKVICSWCKKDMGFTEGHIEGDEMISHGMCDKCEEEFFKDTGDKTCSANTVIRK